MACEIGAGRKIPCKTVGGIKAIYFMNYDVISSAQITEDAGEMIDSFSAQDINLYKYDVRGGNTFDEAGETNEDNGTAFWTATGTVQLPNQDPTSRKELKVLAYGRPRVIVEGWDGRFKIYGREFGCQVSLSTASGGGMGDFNGYSLSIVAKETQPANFVDGGIIGDGGESTVIEGV